MFRNSILKIGILGVWILLSYVANAQKRGFAGRTETAILFSQVDGDQASGYLKWGYSLGYSVDYYFGKKWHYETGVMFANRGSRRSLDPDNPGIIPMHLNYQYLDIPVMIGFPIKKLQFAAGIRTQYLIKAQDKENYILNLESNTKKVGVMGVLEYRQNLSENWSFFVAGMYSLVSIRNNGSNRIFRTSGVYHNNISVGLHYVFNNEK